MSAIGLVKWKISLFLTQGKRIEREVAEGGGAIDQGLWWSSGGGLDEGPGEHRMSSANSPMSPKSNRKRV
jgi:hypothetical protein